MKKYLLSMAVLLAGTMAFTSCDDDDDNGITDPVQIGRASCRERV